MKERLLEFLAYLGIGQNKFEKNAGLSIGFINKFKGNMTIETLDRIKTAYPELNAEWLMTGRGEMLKNRTQALQIVDEEVVYVPLLPIKAQGGSLNDFVISVKDSECEMVVSPIKGADFAITVSGDSMAPEYPSGSQIIIKRINERAFIDWGKVYVLDTCNGVVIKRIFPSDSKAANIIKCVSINPDYPSFEVNLSDVYGVYRVMMLMTVK